jgi:hypothetical protein
MVTSPNVEGTNDLTNSSRGSGTPPWLYHAGPKFKQSGNGHHISMSKIKPKLFHHGEHKVMTINKN